MGLSRIRKLNPSIQAIILTLRPTLLHLTKLILDRETTFAKSSSALQQLARMCVEAARKNMELLKVLQNEDILCW